MPELPEVETVLRGIKEHVLGVAVEAVVVGVIVQSFANDGGSAG